MEFQSVSKNCIKEWYILRSIALLLLGGIFAACFFIPDKQLEETVVKISALIILGMLVVWTAVYAFVFPSMQYRRLKYRIDASRIEKESGVIFLRRQFVPFVRIQHVEIFRGIFDRLFKMSTVIIYTAGSVVRLQNLNIEDAEALVSKIRKLLENEALGDVND